MRSTNVVEHMPTFPGEFDEMDSTTLPTEEVEVTERGVMTRNRAPATLPPRPERTHRPAPQPLFDEAPDPSERTPATWDMGLIPDTFADAEVTEELERRPADLQAILRATEIDEIDTPIAIALSDFEEDIAPTVEAEREPKTSEVELELLEEWLELPSQGDESEPDLVVEFPNARDFPSDPAFPTAGRYESARSVPAPPANRHFTPMPLERRFVQSDAFDSEAETLTHEINPLTVSPAAERVRKPRRRRRSSTRTRLENAGWWAVGALTGALGGTTLASSLLLIAAFI